jgi:hyperosmotically inducible periplasmic protein
MKIAKINKKMAVLFFILINLVCSSCTSEAQEKDSFLLAQNNKKEHKDNFLKDVNITATVKRKLFEDNDINGLRIHVTTQKGKVTLTGTVPDIARRQKVIELARNTKGVHEVIDGLQIGSRNLTSDTGITTLIKLRLLEDENLSGLDIHVETINGTVILTGIVADKDSEEKAILIAKMTNGVKEVDSMLEINKDKAKAASNIISDSIITANIKLSYLEDEYLNSFKIHVKTLNGVVTLTGTLPSEAASERAILIARLTNGVKQVESKLKIGT